MRCKADIHVGTVEDAVHVPIQAVFHNSGQAFVYTPDKGGFAPRPIEIGRSSEMFVEVLSGLDAGLPVLVREPRPDEIVGPLPSSKVDQNATASRRGPRGEEDDSGQPSGRGGPPRGGKPS